MTAFFLRLFCRMSVSLSHVYNTNYRNENLGYGNGFRLSYHQTLKKVTIAGVEYYRHVDGDGTVHYFRYDDTKKKWLEENGLDLTLVINTGTSEPLVIKDKEDNQLVFNSSGYLVKVRDKNSNAVEVTYTNGRITKLTDGANRVINLTYQTDSSGTAYLSQVTAPSGRKKTFAYTSGNLTSITDTDGEKVVYTYDSRNMLASAANVDGYTVKYSYYGTNPYRVKKITESAGTAEGNSLTLTYGYNSTKFTDNKKRSEIHRFDDFGNLVHIHDGFGHAASGKYSGEENHAYRLENETKLQANVVQLLKDPIIQAQTIGWDAKVSPAGAGTTSVNTNASYCKVGTRSLRAESTTLTGYAYWAQSVTVKKGETYTVSMYVRASVTEAAEDGGAILRVRYMDKDNNQQLLDSEVLKRTTNGFVLLKKTFTVPADAGSDSIKIYMVMWHAVGWMCGDMAQLETGDTVNRCNLVDNGDFHLGTVSGFTKTGRVIDGLTTVGAALPIPVQNALTVTASSAALYYRPSTTETQVATVTKGQHLASEISVTADGATWYRARTADGKQGYIQASRAIPYLGGAEGQNSAVVGVTGAILRAAASDSGTPVQEAIPRGTCLSLVNNKLDSNGRRWYYVGMQIDTKRYFGYIREDCVIRLCRNRPYGTLTADDKLYKTMSLSGTVAANLSAGRKVYLRGVATDSSGKKWYSVVSGKEFVFLQDKNLEIGLEPALDRIKTSSVKESIGGLEEHIFRFIGDPAMDKKLTKTLDISGKKGDTYMVNAWGRGTTLPATENGKKERHFGTEVVFVAADGTTDAHYAEFSPDILDWQFLSDICVAKKDYTSIRVSYTYCRNANQAFFDGLALYREEFGQSYTYDKDNNLISVTDAQKNAAKFEYNSSNDMTGVVDARGNKFTYEYDTKHNVTKGTSAEGVVYHLDYDSAGNVTKSGCVDPANTAAGTWMSRTFTSDKNHVSSVTDAGNNTVQYAWDTAKDLLNSMTDARGSRITYGYDAADRLTSVAQNVTLDGTVSTVRNTYTYSKDRLTAISHNGFSYGFTYDGFGNTLGASVAGNQVVSYEYAAKNGGLEKVTYGNGDYIRYTYDSQDRIQLSYFKGASDSAEQKLNEYVYNKEGNPAQIISHMSGKTYSLFYDFLGRLMRVVDEQGTFYEYTYDAENNMTRICHAANGSNLVNTVYTYDKDGRELTAKASGNYIRTTAYDAFGRVASRSWSTPTEYVSSYTYFDSGNNRYSLPKTVTNGGETLTYAYDANGNITSIRDSNGTSTFQYDELNQLVRENNHVLNKTLTYSYDLGGNLKAVKEYAFTTAAALTASPVKTETGTYDSVWKDKLLNWNGTAMTYDAVGNMLTKGSTAYTWTQGRKLSGVNNGKNIRYSYDHTGARTKKVVDGVTTEYRMAGDLLVSEKTGTQTYWYRYDSSANLISATIQGKIYYYVRNAQNDVIALVDSTGAVVVKYTYDSWGKVISITGSLAGTVGVQNPFRYRGYYYDNETEMYYLRNRYYDPEIRRFISADDIELIKTSPMELANKNLYAYCDNNPDAREDSDGKFWELVAVAAVVGAVANIVSTTIATAVTGQWEDYGWSDVFVAGVSGAVNAIPYVGKVASGAISGIYTGVTMFLENKNQISVGEAFFCGVVSGVCTSVSISNLVGLEPSNLYNIAVNGAADIVFGTGYNSVSSVVSTGISSNAETKQNNQKRYSNAMPTDMTKKSYRWLKRHALI
ncbi:MAG: RHS repeat-associated core domain-containing protein [Eubacteriales bacterium]|nr:RHS repeat-associated core domain-containing protein [Eubacteriales bacterium]